MNIEFIDIKAVKPNPKNPRLIKDDAFKKLVLSLQDFPEMLELRPVIVNADNVILGGNMRYRAAKEVGLKQIPIIKANTLDEARQAEFIIKDNVPAGEWDWEMLANEWESSLLNEWGLNVPDFDGVGDVGNEGLTDPDDVPEPEENPVTKVGDLWLLGEHRLLCGDCREPSDVAHLMDGRQVNVAVTSPPYASQRKYDESSGFKPIQPDKYVEWFFDVQANVKKHLAPDGSWFVNIKEHCDDGQRNLYVKDLTVAHVRVFGWRFVDEFAWIRPGPPGSWPDRFKNSFEPVFHFSQGPCKFRPKSVMKDTDAAIVKGPIRTDLSNGKHWHLPTSRDVGKALPSNVLQIGSAGGESMGHQAAYPVALPEFYIKAYSDVGDVIYDPFMGSGTTLIAAEKNDRTGLGIEISPKYCDVIIKRWQDFTGQDAIHEATGKTYKELKHGQT